MLSNRLPVNMAPREEHGFDDKLDLPISISLIDGRYLLFDIQVVAYLRREHQICGAMVGTLPQSPSQNLFLGLPVEIMPEEAQLLVDKGVASIIDDVHGHDQALQRGRKHQRAEYISRVQKQSRLVEQLQAQKKAESQKHGLNKRSSSGSADTVRAKQEDASSANLLDFVDSDGQQSAAAEQAESACPEPEEPSTESSKVPPATLSSTYQVTPATSHLLLSIPPSTPNEPIPDLPPSYPLYRHLHDKGYFMTPGLRFGCQYTVYPGDPLRFHSHFLAVGTEWDEEIDLMDIVGGGRLGTGVKKGYLLGGADPTGHVRTFSIEWAAM